MGQIDKEVEATDLTTKLDPSRVESRHFMSFCMPPNEQLADQSEMKDWLERMVFIYADLKWLLSLEVDLFWCQVREIS